MGRRGVQQLTPAQWREALEQQIREKQQMKESAEQPQRRSQSAPQQDGGEQLAIVPGLERAATTGDAQAVGGRRRVYHQSREDYLRGLQGQIEEKKRLAEEEERRKEQQSTRRRQSRSEDDDSVAAAATGRRSSGEEGGLAESKDANARGDAKLHSDMQQRLEDVKAPASSNQLEAESCPPPVLKAEVAADPVVITKIVDFCEELKKQNEDVKRQLLEQHAVLTSLHSTLEGDGKAASSAPRRRNLALQGSVDKVQLKSGSSIRKPPMKGIDVKTIVPSKVAPRPRPMRGDTKIPFPSKGLPSSLRAAGANIVKGFAPEREAQPKSPLRRVEAKAADPYDRLFKDMPAKEEALQSNEMDADSSLTKVQAPPEAATSEDRGENCTTSDEKQHETKSDCDMNVTNDGHAMSVPRRSGSEEECLLDAESKLVHGWESAVADDKPLECTSMSILDGPSSLVSIDRPLSDLFH